MSPPVKGHINGPLLRLMSGHVFGRKYLHFLVVVDPHADLHAGVSGDQSPFGVRVGDVVAVIPCLSGPVGNGNNVAVGEVELERDRECKQIKWRKFCYRYSFIISASERPIHVHGGWGW